jgi:hypothetical protein
MNDPGQFSFPRAKNISTPAAVGCQDIGAGLKCDKGMREPLLQLLQDTVQAAGIFSANGTLLSNLTPEGENPLVHRFRQTPFVDALEEYSQEDMQWKEACDAHK